MQLFSSNGSSKWCSGRWSDLWSHRTGGISTCTISAHPRKHDRMVHTHCQQIILNFDENLQTCLTFQEVLLSIHKKKSRNRLHKAPAFRHISLNISAVCVCVSLIFPLLCIPRHSNYNGFSLSLPRIPPPPPPHTYPPNHSTILYISYSSIAFSSYMYCMYSVQYSRRAPMITTRIFRIVCSATVSVFDTMHTVKYNF